MIELTQRHDNVEDKKNSLGKRAESIYKNIIRLERFKVPFTTSEFPTLQTYMPITSQWNEIFYHVEKRLDPSIRREEKKESDILNIRDYILRKLSFEKALPHHPSYLPADRWYTFQNTESQTKYIKSEKYNLYLARSVQPDFQFSEDFVCREDVISAPTPAHLSHLLRNLQV